MSQLKRLFARPIPLGYWVESSSGLEVAFDQVQQTIMCSLRYYPGFSRVDWDAVDPADLGDVRITFLEVVAGRLWRRNLYRHYEFCLPPEGELPAVLYEVTRTVAGHDDPPVSDGVPGGLVVVTDFGDARWFDALWLSLLGSAPTPPMPDGARHFCVALDEDVLEVVASGGYSVGVLGRSED